MRIRGSKKKTEHAVVTELRDPGSLPSMENPGQRLLETATLFYIKVYKVLVKFQVLDRSSMQLE